MQSYMAEGRLTRDVEPHQSGTTKIAKFGFAVSNRRKNKQTGEWEDDPVFWDCTCFGKTAETAESYLDKGAHVLLRGNIVLEKWQDKQTGANRQKHSFTVHEIRLLETKSEAEARRGGSRQQRQARPSSYDEGSDYAQQQDEDESIPF